MKEYPTTRQKTTSEALNGMEVAQVLYKPSQKAKRKRKQADPPTFKGTGRREATPFHPIRHGKVKWWRGEILIEGVTLPVVASPSGISLPTGVRLDDDLYERVKAHLTSEAAKLNRRDKAPAAAGRADE